MKQFFNMILCAIIMFGFNGCGGSSGDSPSEQNKNKVALQSSTVFEFMEYPLEPSAVNIRSFVPEDEFDPGHSISLSWNILSNISDSVTSSNKILYNTSVYLSNDMTINDDDLEVFTVECRLHSPDFDYICGSGSISGGGSVDCVYAEDNANTLKCQTFPLDAPVRMENHVVDISSFLNTIPKQGYVLFKACLQESPFTCDEASTPIQFN